MYAIRINDDNTVSPIVNQRIQVGYRNSDWFFVYVNPYYGEYDMYDFNLYIKFVLPQSKKEITEKLILKNDLYNGLMKYVLSSTSKISKESGIVSAKFEFVKGDITRNIANINIQIATSEDYHDDAQYYENNNSFDSHNCNCDSEDRIEKIVEKVKPLVFQSVSDAESQLNSGNIKGIYLGQMVIIPDDNGKYLSYSIQNSSSGYIVEPVDTYSDVYWEDSED